MPLSRSKKKQRFHAEHVMTQTDAAGHPFKAFSRRRRLRRRVQIFSLVCGGASVLAGAVPFCVVSVYLPFRKLSEGNAQIFQRAHCDTETCDLSEVTADPEFDQPNYIVDRSSHYFFVTPTEEIPGFPLRYADAAFVAAFHEPASITAPDGERWRMYSAVRPVGNVRLAVVVGYAEKASWKIGAERHRGH
jgi:hypothetical protein